MESMKIFFLLTLLTFAFSTSAKPLDPFAGIKLHQLPNGMKVVLAPNPVAELIQVKIRVGVGMVHETQDNYGVSHLLEHVLFRNEKLKDDMSYLQLIREKEGEANGTTTWDNTTYWAVMKREHSNWLVKSSFEMLMRPSLASKHVETEKKTVLLEIGEPNPIVRAMGLDLLALLSPRYLQQPSYWEREFGVKIEDGYSATEEQLATLRLTPAQVRAHYEKFYDPSNMQLVISGGFDPKVVLAQVKKLFGSIKGKNIGDQRPRYNAKIKNRPYYFHDFQSGTPRMTVGYQVANVSYEEREVLSSYTEYLSHRLMKRLRNLYGETYTVNDKSDIHQGFGYFAIGLESSREKFRTNFDLIQKLLKEELSEGKLKKEDIEEAKRLYLNGFTLWGDSAESLGDLSEKMLAGNDREGTWRTPYDILKRVSHERYAAILKKYAVDKHRFVMLTEPELFFHYDYIVLLLVSCLTVFFAFRKVLLKPFKNDHVKWVRKVRFPPLKIVEGGTGLVAYFIFIHVFYVADRFIFSTPAFQSMGFAAEYVNVVLTSFLVIATFQAVISFVPRKLYAMDQQLVIKSLSYFSRSIQLNEIVEVSAMAPYQLGLRRTMKLWRSYFYFDPLLRKGIYLELKDGRSLYFSTKDAPKVAQELSGLIRSDGDFRSPLVAA